MAGLNRWRDACVKLGSVHVELDPGTGSLEGRLATGGLPFFRRGQIILFHAARRERARAKNFRFRRKTSRLRHKPAIKA